MLLYNLEGGGIMKNRSLARFVVFALIQVVLCVLAFVFAAGISSAEPEFQTDGSIYVDGTDFTPLAQLGGEILLYRCWRSERLSLLLR